MRGEKKPVPVILPNRIKGCTDAINVVVKDPLCVLVSRCEHESRIQPLCFRPLLAPLLIKLEESFARDVLSKRGQRFFESNSIACCTLHTDIFLCVHQKP